MDLDAQDFPKALHVAAVGRGRRRDYLAEAEEQ